MPSRIDPSVVRHLIKDAGFPSIASFGRHIGLSQSTMDRVLDEKRPHNYNSQTIELIASGLGVSVYDLYKKEAIDEGIAVAEAETVAEAVVEAVAEAVTAVITEVAPDATPQEVAAAIPNEIPVKPPIDLVAYFDYLKTSHETEIKTLTAAYESRIAQDSKNHSRLVNILCAAIAIMIVALLLK